MSEETEWGPNPELYARMAEPYSTTEAADAAIESFFKDLAKLREQHRIPHVVVVAMAHVQPEGHDKATAAVQSLALGSQHCHPEMAASVFATYAGPLLDRADRLRRMAKERPSDDE